MNLYSLVMLHEKITQLDQSIQLNSREVDQQLIRLYHSQLSEHEVNSELLRVILDYWHKNFHLIKLSDFQQLFNSLPFLSFVMEFSNKAMDIDDMLNLTIADLNLVLRLHGELKAIRYRIIRDKLKIAIDLIAALNGFVYEKLSAAHRVRVSEFRRT